MSSRLWHEVDSYITDTLVQPDAALQAALEASDAAGLPQISVSPAHGKLLWLLARILGAKRILEIGTLGGALTDPEESALFEATFRVIPPPG